MRFWTITDNGVKDALLVPNNFGLAADIYDLSVPMRDKIGDGLETLEAALLNYDYIYVDYKYIFPINARESRSAEGITAACADRMNKGLCWEI